MTGRQVAIDITKGTVPIASLVGALFFVWNIANDFRDTVDGLATDTELGAVRALCEDSSAVDGLEDRVDELEKANFRLEVKFENFTAAPMTPAQP